MKQKGVIVVGDETVRKPEDITNSLLEADLFYLIFFFFKQKTAYEIKECDWSSDVCSSDLFSS